MDVIVIFLLFALGTLGMTRIMVDGSIFNLPRKWLAELGDIEVDIEDTPNCTPWCMRLRKFFRLARRFLRWFGRSATSALECHQCTGFWCGVFCGFFLLSHKLFIIFICGCAGSYLSSFAYNVENWVLSNTTFELPPEDQNG